MLGGFYFLGTAFNDKSNATNPHRYLSCVWRNYQNNFKFFSENRKSSCYFWKKRQKNVLKQNSQVGGFYFPGTAVNDKSNGTNPLSVSFLCVEKTTKQFQKKNSYFLNIF